MVLTKRQLIFYVCFIFLMYMPQILVLLSFEGTVLSKLATDPGWYAYLIILAVFSTFIRTKLIKIGWLEEEHKRND